MTPQKVLELIDQGESGSLEFKEEQVRSESLAWERIVFANTLSGVLLIGVNDVLPYKIQLSVAIA